MRWSVKGELARQLLNQMSAGVALAGGVPSFFAPRMPNPWMQPPGSLEATSYYDTTLLKAILERLIDFDRINAGAYALASVRSLSALGTSSTSTTRPTASNRST
jgi:hypothetical protein